jgi:hypothetical protein
MGSFMTTEEVNDVFDAIDEDKNGMIDRTEFENAMEAALTIDEKQLHEEQLLSVQQSRHYPTNEEISQNKKSPPIDDKELPVFISATRRRSLFDHESVFTVHNHKSNLTKSTNKSPPRPAMTLSHRRQHKADEFHTNNRSGKSMSFTQPINQSSRKSGKDRRFQNSGKITNKDAKKKVSPNRHHSHQQKQQQNYRSPLPRSRSRSQSPVRSAHKSPNINTNITNQKDAQGTIAQQRVYSRLQQLRVEHIERLSAIEKRYNGKMEQMSNKVQVSKEHHHADLERAMDEMDEMRKSLIEIHEKNKAAVNAEADKQIAQLEREKIAMKAHYINEIKKLKEERMTLADVAGEIGIIRRQLLQERLAYQELEQEHAEEIRNLLNERRTAEKVSYSVFN